jgi:hypothetical protein
MSVILLNVILLDVILLTVTGEFYSSELHSAERSFAENHSALCHFSNCYSVTFAITLVIIITLSVFLHSVIFLNVKAPFFHSRLRLASKV